MIGNLSVWLLLVYILEGIHQGDTSADTCCKYNTNHTTYTCRGCGMKDVPKQIDGKVTTLDLAQNNLTSLKDDVFSNLTKLINLYLNNNQISHISGNALRGLKNLNELDFRRNKLCISDSNFNGIFNATPHLKTLQLVNNQCKDFIQSYPDEAFQPLKSLQQLSMHFVKDADLGPVFEDLTNLNYLMILGSDGLNKNGGTLGCNTFKTLSNVSLEMLSLRNSGITKICPQALQPLKELKYLNFACNKNLYYSNITDAVNKLPECTLQTLIIDRTGAGEGEIDLSEYKYSSSWHGLQNLSARFMNTGHLYIRNFEFFLSLPKLQYLGFPANMIYVNYSPQNVEKLIDFFNKTKMETADLSYFGGVGFSEKEFYGKFCDSDNIHDEPNIFFRKRPEDVFPSIAPEHNDFDPDAPFEEGQLLWRNLPLSLRYFYFEHFTFGMMDVFQFQFNPLNQLSSVSIANSNFFGRFKTLRNMTNLQIVDASKCGFNNLARKPLNYPNLQKLLLNGNNLRNIGTKEAKWSPFELMRKLKHIDLGNNNINYIQQSSFRDLPLLEVIKLNQNDLTTLNLDLSGSPAIKTIDISQNIITSVSEAFMQSIDELINKHEVWMDMSGNKFDCSCQSLSFIRWFQTTEVQIQSRDTMTRAEGNIIADIDTTWMTFKCFMTRTHLSVVLATLVPTAFLVIVLGLMYKNRYRIQFRYYIMKDRLRQNRRSEVLRTSGDRSVETLCRDDAPNVYISCADEDTDWLYEEVVPRLEDLWGYSTFSRRRDIDMGNPKTSSVASLHAAAVCMCVITPNFCEDGVCLWELEMILAKGEESVLFFCKEQVDPNEHNYISRMIHFYNHIQYGESDSERQVCWNKLKSFIEANANTGISDSDHVRLWSHID